MSDYKPRYTGADLALWQQVHNMLESKIHRLCQMAYDQANHGHKRHVPYSIPDEAQDMVDMLRNLGPETSREDCEAMAGFATSPGVNQAIFGGTLLA